MMDQHEVTGYFEGCSFKLVSGWAWNPACPEEHVSLDLLVDGIKVASTVADGYRKDLEAVDGKGCRAFSMAIPEGFCDGLSHEVTVVRSTSGMHLIGSPKQVNFPEVSFANEVTQKLVRENVLRVAGEIGDPSHYGAKRLVIIAMHQKKGVLDKNQRSLLNEFKSLGAAIVVVNSSVQNADAFVTATKGLCDMVVVRGDHGRDFSSWVIACSLVWKKLSGFEQLVLLNDSVVGPVVPLAPVFNAMDAQGFDVWGLTDSWENFYHLQSYFVAFSRSGFLSTEFRKFLYDYSHPQEKSEVIEQGEFGLSRALFSGSLYIGVYCPYEQIAARWLEELGDRLQAYHRMPECSAGLDRIESGVLRPSLGHVDYARSFYVNLASKVRESVPTNSSHFFWDVLIKDFGFPFLKRELFQYNPSNIPNLNSVAEVLYESGRPEVLDLLIDVMKAGVGTLAPPLPKKFEGRERTHQRARKKMVIESV